MELRPELLPPKLDTERVQILAELASKIDGAATGLGDEWVEQFNRLAGTSFAFINFQGIYGAEEHDVWVRRVLNHLLVHPVADVSFEELVEIVRRAMPQNGYADYEAYMAILDANVPMPDASNLIFYPPDYDEASFDLKQWDPTPEQIARIALGENLGSM